jgi:hypothetical protein
MPGIFNALARILKSNLQQLYVQNIPQDNPFAFGSASASTQNNEKHDDRMNGTTPEELSWVAFDWFCPKL